MNRCYEYCLLKSPYHSFLYISFAILLSHWKFLALQLQRLLHLPGFLTICSDTHKKNNKCVLLNSFSYLCSVPHSLSHCWGIRLCNRLWYNRVTWNTTRYKGKKEILSVSSGAKDDVCSVIVSINYNRFDKNVLKDVSLTQL